MSKDKLLILERVVLLLPLDTTMDNENENGMAGWYNTDRQTRSSLNNWKVHSTTGSR